ncbi:MAG TPA: ABC transporter ATP-binding protein [Alloacidobacterium sp.]|jgi:lipoprotein-releasing system ATP-binding protein|nr:ABC transporter ATP-binding protein [Alloacidobacterium sp.]
MDTMLKTDSSRQIVVATHGLKKTYFGKVATPVLHGIDIAISSGEFVAIIGQSGSGKSTLLNILGALDVPTEGKVFIDGVDIATLSEDGLAALRNRVVGFVFQFHYLLDELSCLENALTSVTISRGEASEEDTARVIALLERVGLGKQLHKRPDTMSGGQNQRCAIIRALANQPKIVLADEPTGNLDSRSGNEVFNIMREMNRENGVAFIMVTHDDRLAQEADRILMIEDGWVHEVDKEEHRTNLLSSLKKS